MRRIEYMRLADIPPAHRNPKAHALGALVLSIARFGFADPALLDERTGRLVGGHGRLSALAAVKAYRDGGGGAADTLALKPAAAIKAADKARAAGAAAAQAAGHAVPLSVWAEFDAITGGIDPETAGEPDGITVDTDGHWLAPVVHGWSSASDDEAEALLVALNRLPEAGGWDVTGLAEILTDMPGDLADLAGYSDDDLAGIVLAAAHLDAEARGLTPADLEPPPPATPPAEAPARVCKSVRQSSTESTVHESIAEPAELRPDPAPPYREQWGLLVTCADSEHQGRALAELQHLGYRVEPVRS